MKKYWIYGIISILIIITFLMGYFILKNFVSNPLVNQQVNQQIENNNMATDPNIQLRPGEIENRLDGTITSINIADTPATIVITPLFAPTRFSVIPQGVADRKVELSHQNLVVLQGAPFAVRPEEITKQDLKIGDRVVITTIESVLDIATLDKYTAVMIRRVVFE